MKQHGDAVEQAMFEHSVFVSFVTEGPLELRGWTTSIHMRDARVIDIKTALEETETGIEAITTTETRDFRDAP